MSDDQVVRGLPTRFQLSIESRELYEYMRKDAHVGKFWTYDEMDAAAKCDVRRTGRIQTVKSMLLREGIVISPVTGKGMRVLTPEETVTAGDSYTKHIRKTAHRGIRLVSCVEYDELDAEHQKRFNANLSVLAVLRQFSGQKAVKRISEAVENTHGRLPVKRTLVLFGENGKKTESD